MNVIEYCIQEVPFGVKRNIGGTVRIYPRGHCVYLINNNINKLFLYRVYSRYSY